MPLGLKSITAANPSVKLFRRRNPPEDTVSPSALIGGNFSLGFDRRKPPRIYRGKVHAAEALHEIYKLAKEFRNRRWSVEQLIVLSWDQRPRASRDFQCSK
tara:strand:+ start:96 stop:398 length:303 start_codon:yes stop_codon:yes gene_type:complete